MLEWSELLQLSPLAGKRDGGKYQVTGAPDALVTKLNDLFNQPFLSNKAFKDGARPFRPTDAKLGGPTIRAGFWNMERGQELPAILETFEAAMDPSARDALFDKRIKTDLRAGDKRAELETQLDALGSLDIIVLNEVDRFMKRSGYVDVVEELGRKLEMNWAWNAEFVEIDPVWMGTEKFERKDFLDVSQATGQVIDDGRIPESELMREVAEATMLTQIDASKSRQLHGNAILSRYPIVRVRAMPLDTVCWDWNEGEKKGKSFIQVGKDILAEKLFLEKSMRQIRHGQRTMMVADLYVPGVNAVGTSLEQVPGVKDRANIVTVVSAHVEAKSKASCRAKQMKEIMAKVADIKNPIVFGGDLNTFGGDGRPTTVESLLLARFGNWQYITRKLIGRLSPYAGWVFTTLDIINWVRLKDDPTGINIPIFLPNPERGLFDAVENAVFADAARMDFRGDKKRTVNGTEKTLANSNQRDSKGFKTTHGLTRTYGIGDFTIVGKFKLDWMFVKGFARSPRDTKASYRMAPHFPRTLEELRDATIDPTTGKSARLSDHAPMTMVLPIKDPCKEGSTCSGDEAGALEFGDVTWEDANTEPTP